ncbi:toxin glutamine deamidase domain-containing protein [Micromonospora sp. C28ISP2-4]|uniref:toxin glutamine deamidase domain-containing protein n=1 Tax=Micromonospora sp. C28ISP2-4 TaxID=3059523 RepID=UPI0026750694|nr:toxin glutamine deamidase domain-containing protein [Micromonospora sp. C28ISP2-4]MDO3682891.1 toxin glutamine deamidase domain-containing protein [Micromonospora sp. C28ISP2-4]
MLPSPIPHPLDFCPWDLPGWIYEALGWVVGVEWPEGNERAVWDLADQWYGVAGVLTRPRDDAITAAGEVKSGYGGVGLVAGAFDTAWHKLAEGEDAPLHVLVAATDELARLVDSCGCDIEGAKLEAWIELGILVIELLSLAVATVLTLGAASPAAAAAITATRVVVQQIFKRLVAQLARKAVKQGLKEAGERAAKEVAKSGVRTLARRAAIGGLLEAGQEAGTSLGTQAYQNSTGRRDGLDLTDVSTSALGGFAGGAVAPLAGLGRHANGRFAEIGERFGREMAGETLAETAAGLATGQGPSLEGLARAAASGATGSATNQADSALQRRLDGQLSGLTVSPVGLDTPVAADPVGLIPAQRAAEPIVQSSGDAMAGSVPVTPTHVTPQAVGPHPLAVDLPQPVPESTATPPLGDAGPHEVARPTVATSPTLSSVITDAPLAGASSVAPGVHGGTGPVVAPIDHASPPSTSPVQTAAAPTTLPAPPTDHPQTAAPPASDRAAPISTGGQAGLPVSPVGPQPGAPAVGPEPRPVPNPRFPLLESLAPPRPPIDSAGPNPGPLDVRTWPRETAQQRAARLKADREGLDRRRYQGYLRSQRALHEENRRQAQIKELRDLAEQHYEAARWLLTRAHELRQAGRHDLANSHVREGRRRERLHYRAVDEVEAVRAGERLPKQVMVDDDLDFYRINDDVADLAVGAVETADHSALTGNGHPEPIDRSRPYGRRGGLRPPLALHQTDLERQMPRNPDGSVTRTADPRRGGWFRLANDGGPAADATRGINCLDCTLSLFETWVHGRPRVAAPRTFDGYLNGDVNRPVGGEADGPLRVEQTTGGRFQNLCPADRPGITGRDRQLLVDGGYRDLYTQLASGGHGSYAFLITSFEGGGSHAWVALNQNGTILFLDPQTGLVADRPIYHHSGRPDRSNVVGVDALVLGPDGRPMPLPGRPLGTYNVLPEPLPRPAPPRPPAPPPITDGHVPDFNHVHLLGESTTFHRQADGPMPGSAPPVEPEPARVREEHRRAHADRIAAGLYVRDALAQSGNLNAAFAAGVTPVELAQHADVPTLRRLVPGLDESAATDLTRLFADPRVQRMLDQSWEAPPRREELLAETLVRQLAERPDLVRMILATPELANSLTARPLTLHHLASHQQAINVLQDVLVEIRDRGSEAVAAARTPSIEPTPLSPHQIQVSSRFDGERSAAVQPNFDKSRSGDLAYRKQYLDHLYQEAVTAQRELDSLGRELAGLSASGAEYKPRPGPKDRVRAEDKIERNGGNAARLRDLAAGRVAYQTLDDLYAGLAELSNNPHFQVAKFSDRFREPQDSGYRDIQFSVQTSTGHIGEFRLHLAALDQVAEWEHSLFEVWRDLEAVPRSEARSLSVTEVAIRKGIVRRQREYFWAALQTTLNGERQ